MAAGCEGNLREWQGGLGQVRGVGLEWPGDGTAGE